MSPLTRDLIVRGARQHSERTAVICADRRMTFREVDDLSSRLAHAMLEQGCEHRSRVALLVNNSIYSVPTDFACVKAGVNRVPLNSRLSVEEHSRMIAETGCTALFYGPDLADRARHLAQEFPGLRCVGLESSFDNTPALYEVAATMPTTLPDVAIEPDDVILTLFTSGTTGVLKAAQHTQRTYAAIARNVLLNLLPVAPDDVMAHSASLIHASGVFVLPFWLRGATTLVLPGFDPDTFFEQIATHRVTSTILVPTMVQMLLQRTSFDPALVSSLRYLIYGASPMPLVTIEQAMTALPGVQFLQYYGQTEAPLCLTVLRHEDHHGERLRSCGQPALDVEIRLLDEDGEDVEPGTPGEIVVRSPAAAVGYFNAPDLNEVTFTEGGWVHTRDIGVFDEHGFLYLKDRLSDMIISGGYNVYPREVEERLLAHPAVAEAIVVGTPDPIWVEAVTAVVVLAPGYDESEQLRTELVTFVAEGLASYKKPRNILFRSSVPKTAVGKLDRKSLRQELGHQSEPTA
ncbi:class I adenylate-forming enzyme family protein [Nocardia africana]|uniref:3-hydroxybenzoate--CoA/4-hydroxybenzoate--CoA ligase n=1 Tax=Nocardia africana TaxID=134964 RepID=A0A378WWY0_9NOCA|nr:AMP-binding protein [Nocardia africana]MCC3312940.1 AMP-binding protein [Nocardia africana]SUA45718.1 3-hydroxybenzoate--CoA/4-hydroxybenzoate--CoA ligase [Nocardia africana]